MNAKSMCVASLALTITLLFFSILIQNVQAQNQLSVSVNVSNDGEYTQLTGIVRDANQNPVPVAAVSIQAVDPTGKVLHVSLVYTDQSGQFTDRFKTLEWFDGQGTIYVSVTKAGYENTTASAAFTPIPEFSKVYVVAIVSTLLVLTLSKKYTSRSGNSGIGLHAIMQAILQLCPCSTGHGLNFRSAVSS